MDGSEKTVNGGAFLITSKATDAGELIHKMKNSSSFAIIS
jgi:hypothetical protein